MEDIDLCDIERSIEKLRDYRPHDAEKINKLQDTLQELKSILDEPVPFHWVVDENGRLEYEPRLVMCVVCEFLCE